MAFVRVLFQWKPIAYAREEFVSVSPSRKYIQDFCQRKKRTVFTKLAVYFAGTHVHPRRACNESLGDLGGRLSWARSAKGLDSLRHALLVESWHNQAWLCLLLVKALVPANMPRMFCWAVSLKRTTRQWQEKGSMK